jgi:hypothetical protein
LYPHVRELAEDEFPVAATCRVLKLTSQPYYPWLTSPVSDAELAVPYRANALFGAVPAGRSDSESEVLARCRREGLEWTDVAVDQDAEILVPGLGGDAVQRHAGECRGGGVPCAQGVGGDAGAVEACGFGAGAEHAGGDVAGERFEADPVAPDPGEQCTGGLTPDGAPDVEVATGSVAACCP